MTKSEALAKFAMIEQRLDEVELRSQRAAENTPRYLNGAGPFLPAETKMAPFFKTAAVDYDLAEVKFGSLVAAMVGGGKVTPYLSEAERKAYSELAPSAGGYLVPSAIGAMFLDAIRPATRVLQAGAPSYPLVAASVSLPGWDDPPVASWRGEGDAFAASGGTFRAVTLTAKSIATYIDISIELLDDAANNLPGVAAIIEREFIRAISQAIDKAALIGTGSDHEPTGLATALTPTHVGATPASYAFLARAVGTIRGNNFEPNAAIYSPRTATTLDLLTDSLGQPLRPPASVAGLSHLPTNQVPNDLGSGGSESLAFVGDWSRLVVGFRPSMGVRILVDPYSQLQPAGMTRIHAWQRADVAILNEDAFVVLDRITDTPSPPAG